MSKLLWEPSEQRIKKSNIYKFMNMVNETHNQNFVDYAGLYQWSIDHIPEFWAAMWDFAGIKASEPYTEVVNDLTPYARRQMV